MAHMAMWKTSLRSLGQGMLGQRPMTLQSLRGSTRAPSRAGQWATSGPLGTWPVSLG